VYNTSNINNNSSKKNNYKILNEIYLSLRAIKDKQFNKCNFYLFGNAQVFARFEHTALMLSYLSNTSSNEGEGVVTNVF